jgi:transposase InsO family protein
MSRARLVITAVVVENRPVAQVADAYGVHRAWVYKLLARYRAEGEAAFEPRSRRPKRSPNATPLERVELVLRLRKELAEQGLDAGPQTLIWHLGHHHDVRLSAATVHRILTRHGLVTPEPKKRPKASYTRFEAELPNQMWQTDFTHYRLDDGTPQRRDVEILNFLDDHSRLLLTAVAYPRVTGPAVAKVFTRTVAEYGIPASVLSDNGMVFTTRFAGGRGGKNAFEKELRRLHVVQKNSSPNHPQTCGKIERLHQTLKKWLTAQTQQPNTIAELQALLDRFRDEYNTRRPHRSLARRTPAAAYAARAKATPTGPRTDTHDRIRHDRIDDSGVVTLRHNGRLHHIGIGRTHARTHVIMLIQDLHIRVIAAATGELLRELTLDPTRDYQPRGQPQPRNRPNP